MSTVKVATRHLVGMMEDLARTTNKPGKGRPFTSTVLLHSDHADIAVESEQDEGPPLVEEAPSDVLVGTSTTTRVMGQAHAPCEGTLHRVVSISVGDAKAIKDVFKPLIKTMGSETHFTELVLAGDTLTVSEDPDLVSGGNVLSVHVVDPEGFPHGIEGAMNPDPLGKVWVKRDGDQNPVVVPPSYGTGLFDEHLLAMGAISKRRKMPVRWYRSHQKRGIVVTVGAWYRAVLSPAPLDPDTDEADGPLVRVFLPPFPAEEGQGESLMDLCTATGVVLD